MPFSRWLGFNLLGVDHKESTLICVNVNMLCAHTHICWPQLISKCFLLNECGLVILDLLSDFGMYVSVLNEEKPSCFFST